MQGPDPSLAYRPNVDAKKTKEEYRNFEVMAQKCVCSMRDIVFESDATEGPTDGNDRWFVWKSAWKKKKLNLIKNALN